MRRAESTSRAEAGSRPATVSRAASVAATATTLVALIAMAAAAPAQGSLFTGRPGMTQVALARGDAHAVRAVAAVVKAARDLLAGSRHNAVLPATTFIAAAPPRSPHLRIPAGVNDAREDLLAERLLDLPPPTC